MPVYTYRREDDTTFEIQQKFLNDALTICPTTGQKVMRIIQTAGIIFKGSGFYVTDSKKVSKSRLDGKSEGNHKNSSGSESKSETKTKAKLEKTTDTKAAD